MRVARDFAAGGARSHRSPERPRVADPDRRRRIADYLEGGTVIGRGRAPEVLHTDGLWLWPERFVDEILDAGLAPEIDFVRHMEARSFRAPAPVLDNRLTDDALAAWRSGPPPPPRLLITYFVRVDDESTVDAPLSLLRRVVTAEGARAEEGLWRDLSWHPTHTFVSHVNDYDIREVSAEHAAGVMDRWCAKWHDQLIARTRNSTSR